MKIKTFEPPRLRELRRSIRNLQRADVPHCSLELLKAGGYTLPPVLAGREAEVDEYLKRFAWLPAQPGPGQRCPFCDETWTSRWALAHGEVFCAECGYPGRAYHYTDRIPGMAADAPRWELVLWAHPRELLVDDPHRDNERRGNR